MAIYENTTCESCHHQIKSYAELILTKDGIEYMFCSFRCLKNYCNMKIRGFENVRIE